jgi:hypothetical protein
MSLVANAVTRHHLTEAYFATAYLLQIMIHFLDDGKGSISPSSVFSYYLAKLTELDVPILEEIS